MGKRGISIIDIARMAGVSKTTVSNVLNGKGRVGEDTKSLIMEIAEREGYVANFAARSLRASETRTVGILTPDVSNEFFSAIVMRIERALYRDGYTSFVCDTESDPGREASYERSLLQKQVDGLISVSDSHPFELSSLPEGLPVVVVDREVRGQRASCAWVGNDVRAITHDMTATLTRRGCTHIAFLSVSASVIPTEESERYLGYVEALAEAGVRLRHELVLRSMHRSTSRQEAYLLVDQMLSKHPDIDGIVAMGDRVAFGAMEALRAHGLEPGSDVLVIGCDDSPLCLVASPTLSSVNRNVDELSTHAAETLIAMMNGQQPNKNHVTVGHQIVERNSTSNRS